MLQNLESGFTVRPEPDKQRAAVSTLKLFESGLIEFKNVIEFLALLTGDKKVVRLVLTREQARQVGNALAQYCANIDHGSSQYVLREVFRSTRWDSFHERFLKATEDNEDVRAHFFGETRFVSLAVEAEDHAADALTLGTLFGIPECCALAYRDSLNASGKWMQVYMRSLKTMSVVDATANRFSSVFGNQMGFHFDYFPCSFDCQKTLQISRANRERLLHFGFDTLVELADANSKGIAIHLNDHVYYTDCINSYKRLSVGQKMSTSGFAALTPNAPELPTFLTYSDSRIHMGTLAMNSSPEDLSICCFVLSRDLT